MSDITVVEIPLLSHVIFYNDKIFKDNGIVHNLSKNHSGRAKGALIEENFAAVRDSEPMCAKSVPHCVADKKSI